MTTGLETTSITRFDKAGVRGFLHWPERPSGVGLVLVHGAGSDCTTPLLTEIARAFAAASVAVLRCDLPFRQERARGPPFPARAAADRAGLRDALAALHEIVPGPVYLGGHSYGGRQATILASDEPAVAPALLLLSYPLHPPGKPSQLRTDHFSRLGVRLVFVHGTNDPFGTIDELREAVSLVPAQVSIVPIDRAGHDLRRGRFQSDIVIEALLDRIPAVETQLPESRFP